MSSARIPSWTNIWTITMKSFMASSRSAALIQPPTSNEIVPWTWKLLLIGGFLGGLLGALYGALRDRSLG